MWISACMDVSSFDTCDLGIAVELIYEDTLSSSLKPETEHISHADCAGALIRKRIVVRCSAGCDLLSGEVALPSTVSEQGVRALLEHAFLWGDVGFHVLSKSRVLCALADAACKWRDRIQDVLYRARPSHEMLLSILMSDGRFVRLLAGAAVLASATPNAALTSAARALAVRFVDAFGPAHVAIAVEDSSRADRDSHRPLGIVHACTVCVDGATLSRLFALNAFDTTATEACAPVPPFGFVVPVEHRGVALLAAHDADPASLLPLISSRASQSEGTRITIAHDDAPRTVRLVAGVMHREAAQRTLPLDALDAYRVRIVAGAVPTAEFDLCLELDDGAPPTPCASGPLLPPDAVELSAKKRAMDDERADSRRRELARRFELAFPRLALRAKAHGAAPAAAGARELLARRHSREWTLRDIEHGGDLSSLGASVTLALLWSLHTDGEPRVMRARGTGAACVAVFCAREKRTLLVDPLAARGTKWTELACAAVPTLPTTLRPPTALRCKQSFVEVWVRRRWRVALVVDVDHLQGTVGLRMVAQQCVLTLPLQSTLFRPLARESGSEIDGLLASLLAIVARFRKSNGLQLRSDTNGGLSVR